MFIVLKLYIFNLSKEIISEERLTETNTKVMEMLLLNQIYFNYEYNTVQMCRDNILKANYGSIVPLSVSFGSIRPNAK